MNSSQIPHDIKRYTLVSKDNNILPSGKIAYLISLEPYIERSAKTN